MSYAVSAGNDQVVITGGSLRYGSVGRPDLVSHDATVAQDHDQLHSARKLAGMLSDDAAVFPTHGFSSFCSAGWTWIASRAAVRGERAVDQGIA